MYATLPKQIIINRFHVNFTLFPIKINLSTNEWKQNFKPLCAV